MTSQTIDPATTAPRAAAHAPSFARLALLIGVLSDQGLVAPSASSPAAPSVSMRTTVPPPGEGDR